MADDTARDADEFLKYLSETEHEIPYSKRAIGIFLEAIAAAIAGIVAIAPDNRTPTTYLAILSRELSYRNRALAGHLDLPDSKDLEALQRRFRRVVEIHGHHREQASGYPLPQCALEPPCPYHS